MANGETLEPEYRDHALAGKYQDYRDCHLEPDWVLIYQSRETLVLVRTGSHSDLFN
jgi:mRNA interferase YafQ